MRRRPRRGQTVREGIVATEEVGLSRTYGRFIRENGIAYAFELGDWDEADRLAEESIAITPPVARSGATA